MEVAIINMEETETMKVITTIATTEEEEDLDNTIEVDMGIHMEAMEAIIILSICTTDHQDKMLITPM